MIELKNCIAEWLRTTHSTDWKVYDDGSDVWMQYGADWQSLPHYFINDKDLIVGACCPLDKVFWELDATHPNFFASLAKKMELDEAKCDKPAKSH